MKKKSVKWFAVLWFAVTMTMASVAQDSSTPSSAPPNDPQAEQQQPGQATQEVNLGQDSNVPNNDADSRSNAPQSKVARVSLIRGEVSMQRGDSSEWTAVTVNTPLVQGDQIATGDGGRAEIQLDYATTLRLAAQSQVKMANLSGNQIQVQVAKGYTNLSVFKSNEANVEVDTPNVSVHPLRAGRYRIQVNSDTETDVIVRSGEVEITTPQGSTRVTEGRLALIRGTDNPEYKIADAPSGDDWDRWNRDRDRSIQEADSWHNTNRYYTGSNDLDANGRWIYVPGYGNVWQPNDQGPNWAPYQNGRWVWEPYYGWTWVSYEPWGWAPYHYGRWFYWNTGWVWWPGPIYPFYRPLWSPAFVTFFGFGWRAGFGFGTIGWCPVGPFDPFFPWFGFGFHRVNVINITNINVINVRNFNGGRVIAPLGVRGRQPVFSNVNMALTNARVRAGITTVSSANFGRGVGGSHRFGAVDAAQLRGAHVMTANVPVVPTRESLQPGRAGSFNRASTVQPHASQHFFTRNAPPAAPPSFHQQAAQMQQMVHGSIQNGGMTPGSTIRSEGQVSGRGGNASGPSRTGVGERGMGVGSGSGSPGAMGAGSGRGAERMNTTEDHAGWQRFGGNNSENMNSSRGQSGAMQTGPGRSSESMSHTPERAPVDRSTSGRSDRPGWARFSQPDRGGAPENSSGRQQLQMERPIVTPRTPANSNSRPEMQRGPSGPPPRSIDSRSPHQFGGNSGPYSGPYSRNSAPYGGGRNYGGGGRSYSYGGGGGSHSYGGGGHSSGGGGGHSSGGGGSRSSSGSSRSH